MTYYLDTSALVKRYVREPGSATVRSLFRRKRSIAVSRIAYAELAAAVARAWRAGALDETERDDILRAAEQDFRTSEVVEVRAALVRRVPDLVVRAPLRGYDAVHVASALALKNRGMVVDFWSADDRLLDAARSEGLRATLVA
jgi:predicted nucleic acid-binding protein